MKTYSFEQDKAEKERIYKEYKNKYQNYSKSKKIIEKVLTISNMQSSRHFDIIAGILSNTEKYNFLSSMPENKCYEIEKGDFSIAIIAKNKILHIQPVSTKPFNLNFVVENFYIEDFSNLSKFFSHSDFVDKINKVQKLDNDIFLEVTVGTTKICLKQFNDYISISGKPF